MKNIILLLLLLLTISNVQAIEKITYDFDLMMSGINDYAYIGNILTNNDYTNIQPFLVGPTMSNSLEFQYYPGGWSLPKSLPQPTTYQLNKWYDCCVVLNFSDSRMDWTIDGEWKGAAPLRDDSGTLRNNNTEIYRVEMFAGDGSVKNLYITME